MNDVIILSEELRLSSLSLSEQIFETAEIIRLKKLQSYQILDTNSEACFDAIVSLASFVCKTPNAAISFIGKDRQWLKAKVGNMPVEIPREYSLCNVAIQTPKKPFVINHFTKFKVSSSVLSADLIGFFEQSPFNLEFYAGFPLVTSTGEALGTLCVLDEKPRKVSVEQIQQLVSLTQLIIHLLENRK